MRCVLGCAEINVLPHSRCYSQKDYFPEIINTHSLDILHVPIMLKIRGRDHKEGYIYYSSNVGKTKNCHKEMSHSAKQTNYYTKHIVYGNTSICHAEMPYSVKQAGGHKEMTYFGIAIWSSQRNAVFGKRTFR